MYTISYIKNLIIVFFYQAPGLPGVGDPEIDAAPIDDYLIVGLIVGMFLIIVLSRKILKSKIPN